MHLTYQIAKKILDEICTVIEEDINIMNETGLILASTDKDRISTIHEGARLLINDNMEQLVVTSDDQYKGCKKGTNLPIHLNSEIVGVIGITGDPDQTMKYGLILKKMTEMILYESFKRSEQFGSEQEKNMLINDLVHGNFKNLQYDLEDRMKRSGISISGKFTVAIIKNTAMPDIFSAEESSRIILSRVTREIINEISSSNVHIMYNGSVFIIIACTDYMTLYKTIENASAKLNKNPRISIFCTIGNDYEDYMNIYRSYNEASNILSYFECKPDETGLYLFNNIMLDYVIEQLPKMHRENLKKTVFEKCREDEIPELCDFIISFFNADGSLTALSEKYFAHKNTIQYKIQKIMRKTGYDLRKNYDLFILYIAAVCVQHVLNK